MVEITKEAIVSTSGLACVLGVSMRRIQQLAKEGILTKCGRDAFRCASEVQAYMKYAGCSTTINPKKVDYRTEKALLTKAQREKAEMEVTEIREETYRADYIIPIFQELLLGVRNRLLSVPDRCAPLLMGVRELVEMQEIVKNEIYDALTELSTWKPKSLKIGKK